MASAKLGSPGLGSPRMAESRGRQTAAGLLDCGIDLACTRHVDKHRHNPRDEPGDRTGDGIHPRYVLVRPVDS